MKILNISIEIVNNPKNIESTYMSRRSDFVRVLNTVSEF